MTDLTVQAQQATTRARLAEQVLLDAVQARAIAEHQRAEPKAPPPVAVVWIQDAPPAGALIGGQPYQGREGELRLLDSSAADVLQHAGYVELREPLTLPAWQRPEVAEELRQVAEELVRAAGELDPQG